MGKRLIVLDGEYLKMNGAEMDALAPWRLRGRGVFETMRSYHGCVFQLERHLRRLRQGLKVLGIHFGAFPSLSKDLREEDLVIHIANVLRRNRMKNCRIRLTVWKDRGGIHFSILVFVLDILSQREYRTGVRACLFDKFFSFVKPAIKSIAYQPFLKAYGYAVRRGCGEALLLNREGYVVEGSRANLFIVKKGVISTPTLSLGCLRGITRQVVIELARQEGISVREARFCAEALLDCDEAFLTNSAQEILPLTQIQDAVPGRGLAGAITMRLRELYRRKAVQETEPV